MSSIAPARVAACRANPSSDASPFGDHEARQSGLSNAKAERSKLAAGGETVDVTFVAPEPGTYPFICTMPGHYIMMKGKLIVTP